MSGWMPELREEVVRAVCEVEFKMPGAGGLRGSLHIVGGHSELIADAILSLPRIQEALKALEEQEAMDRKLGHSAKC